MCAIKAAWPAEIFMGSSSRDCNTELDSLNRGFVGHGAFSWLGGAVFLSGLHWHNGGGSPTMCRNIRTLFNFEPPVTEQEVNAAALQFVRKISGFNKPSQANEAAFNTAIAEVAAASMRLLT